MFAVESGEEIFDTETLEEHPGDLRRAGGKDDQSAWRKAPSMGRTIPLGRGGK
jgi:hypothetical protein